MAGGGKLLVYSAAICAVTVFCAVYPALEFLTIDKPDPRPRDLSSIGFVLNLWRPVFISIAVLCLLCLMVATGRVTLLRKLGDLFTGIPIFIGKLASWIILILVMIIMFDVVTRKIEFIKIRSADITVEYGFSISFILQDLQWHLHGVLLLMSFGFGYMMNAHVRVDIFRERAARRGQAWIETLGLTLLAIPFMLVMIGFSWDLFYASFKGWEGSESMVGLGWRWIIKSFLIWGFGVALLAMLGTLMRTVIFLFGDIEEQAIAEESIQYFTDSDTMSKLILEQNRDNVMPGEQK